MPEDKATDAETREVAKIGFDVTDERLALLNSANKRLVALGAVYCGMGHYGILVRGNADHVPANDEKAYQVVHLGGSNGYESEERDERYKGLEPQGKFTLAELKKRMAEVGQAEGYMECFFTDEGC